MRALAIVLVALTGAGACGGAGRAADPTSAAALPDVRQAKDRPPVVVVAREGDPASAVAVAATTAETDDEVEAASALAGVLEARLDAKGVRAVVTPTWDGLRAVALASSAAEATIAADAIREAMLAKTEDKDVAAAQRKLAALAQRPLRDAALGPWARCVGSPFQAPERAGRPLDATLAKIEQWRTAVFGLGRVALGVAGPSAAGDAVATAIARGPAWKAAHALTGSGAATTRIDVYEVADQPTAVLHVALDVGTSGAAVTTAEALGDPRGPLAARLAELDLPFRIREVTGTAHPRGGCVGVVLEGQRESTDLAARVGDAIALVDVEVEVHLADGGARARDEGRVLARRAGDARESAERAAWWALVDKREAKGPGGRAVALGVPTHRGSLPTPAPDKEAVTSAIERANLGWKKPAVEARARVELGQGETWILLASPCGTDAEAENDAGLTALFALAAAEGARGATDTRVEPWIAPEGVGLLVHGPARPGETAAAHARRLADVVGRSFAAEAPAPAAISRARSELLPRDTPGLFMLAGVLAPQHPSWIFATGSADAVARSSDSAVLARAQSVRAGPLRLAILAGDPSQPAAAQRAADRWVARRAGDARACKPAAALAPVRAGTYAIDAKPGTSPEAYLAYPFPADDEAARTAATVFVAALDGDDGLLERALASVAHVVTARVIGLPRSPAVVVRIGAQQAQLDAAVMQVRALIDRLHQNGLSQEEVLRALGRADRARVAALLDPRARLAAAFRGDLDKTPARPSAEELKTFAQTRLGEDTLVVVASRPPRTTTKQP